MVASPISVFIPFYNEETVVEDVVKDAIEHLEALDRDFELILVDDGSTDATTDKIRELDTEFSSVKAVLHDENQGYGNALKTGFKKSSYPLIAYLDGDGQFTIKDLDKLLKNLDGNDIVTGIRENRRDPVQRRITGVVFNKLIKTVFNVEFRDIDCGLKLVRREVIDEVSLNTDRTVDAELLVKAHEKNFSIHQIKVRHYNREKGESEASGLIGVRVGLILTTLKEINQIREDLK